MAGENQQPSHRYVEVADDLRRRIAAQEWKPGQRIAGHRALRDHYGVSDAVMSAARQLLVTEGLLDAREATGTYVRKHLPRRRIVRSERTLGDPNTAVSLRGDPAFGISGAWSVRTDTINADQAVADLLDVPLGSRIVESTYRIRSAGQLVRLTTCYEPHNIIGGTLIVLPEYGPYAGGSVQERMAAIGIAIGVPEETVIARNATDRETEALGSGASPVLEVTRTHRNIAGVTVHVERTVLRGDSGALVYHL